jgi:hypothetical protein
MNTDILTSVVIGLIMVFFLYWYHKQQLIEEDLYTNLDDDAWTIRQVLDAQMSIENLNRAYDDGMHLFRKYKKSIPDFLYTDYLSIIDKKYQECRQRLMLQQN